tara:strand:+ start:1696 stop:2343 length:648 start_codon:yes stop_codon:yes gene_type:complete
MDNRAILALALGSIGIIGLSSISKAKSGSITGAVTSHPTVEEENLLKNAEIIGDYISHGYGGTAFRLPDGNVLKIVSLEKSLPPPYNKLNTDQADFFEKLHNGDMTFNEDMVEIKHFGRGRAWVKMVQLVNSESPGPSTDLSVGEKIAYWVMEYVPTIGNGEMPPARVNGGIQSLENWGKKNGWLVQDFKDTNYGERSDGSFVMFDPWVEPLESR